MCTNCLFLWSVIHFISPTAQSLATSALITRSIFLALIALTAIIFVCLAMQKFLGWLVNISEDINWESIWKNICELPFAKISAALYAISFALSVLYNFIYLNSVGISLTKSPISLGDYALTALLWAPIVAIYSTLILINAFLNSIWNLQKSVYKLLFTTILVLIVPGWILPYWWIFRENSSLDDAEFLAIIFILSYPIFVILLRNPIDRYRITAYPTDSQSKFSKRFKFFILWGIPLFIETLIFLFCLIPKYADVSTKCPPKGAHIPGKHVLVNKNVQIDGVLARVFETHYLIRNCESGKNMNRMEFIRADRVDKIIVEPQKQPRTEKENTSSADRQKMPSDQTQN